VNDVGFARRAAFFESASTLVLADTHIGRDESSAVSLPLGEATDLRDRLGDLLARFDPQTVVIAGDVVHTFGGVSQQSRESLARLETTCTDADTELVLVAGNHDTGLKPAWDGPVVTEYALDGAAMKTVVCHGHEEPTTPADRYVCGHVHPTIEIEGVRHPCTLYDGGGDGGDGRDWRDEGDGENEGNGRDVSDRNNKTDDAAVICLPAFTRLAPGVAVNEIRGDALATPLLTDTDRLEPIVFDTDANDVIRFPPLGEFRRLL